MKEREFWREQGAGRVYAVELEDGIVTGSCGPLDVIEIDERFLPTFDYARERADWLEQRRDEFELVHGLSPYTASYGSSQQTLALRSVASAMHHGVITCHPGSTLRDVARTMANAGVHAVVVAGDGVDEPGGLSGIVSDVDLIAAAARGAALAGSAVGAAHTEVVTVLARDTLLHATHLMEQHGVTHLVVVAEEGGRPVGVLSTLDVARSLARAA
jgi:CBS domain-containing protein